jgi:predicted Zn-dependent peptidase
MTRAFPERPPAVGTPTTTRFPPIIRDRLSNGLAIWVIEHDRVPVASMALLIDRGTSSDPTDRPGRTALSTDLLDEGAGERDAIELADAFERLGSQLRINVGPDVLQLEATTLTRFVAPMLALVADVVSRPGFGDTDFTRVRDLRLNRLRQLSRQPGASADRSFLAAVFGTHPYGHGALGTTPALEAMTLEDARSFVSESVVPHGATLVVAGDVRPDEVIASADAAFAGWTGRARPLALPPVERAGAAAVTLVDRPDAAQSVLRVGHVGPARRTEDYYELVVLDAVLGGQFSSRINQNLREEKGLTYGARTGFGFRRAGGSFCCQTSVDTDRTTEAVVEILREFDEVRGARPVTDDELALAKSALCRGYARNFETAGQVAGAATQLATYGLPDSTFDEFVPRVGAVTAEAVTRAAEAYVRPDESHVVVVGDRARCLAALDAVGRPLVEGRVAF